MKHGDDWKLIAEEMKLKNGKEAILEFLRIPLDLDKDTQYLLQHTYNSKIKIKDAKSLDPYNQAD